MIREKYQYSGFTNIVGTAVVSDVPTLKARFMKKCYTAEGTVSSFGGPETDPRLMKERHKESAVYTDPSIPVSQVHVRRDRYYDAERDHIKRFQRGDYDGDFPLGARPNAKPSGFESLLSAIGDNGMVKRRKSFVFIHRVENDVMFDKDGKPQFEVAYHEGLGEDQSRRILREMERKYRKDQLAWDDYNTEKRIRDAEEYRRRQYQEEVDELERLKEKLKRQKEHLESVRDDVAGEEDFHEQMDRIKKLLGKGKSFGGDTIGDEFMEQGGDQHRVLVDEYNRLFPGGRGTKQRLYNALHYGAVVDDSEAPMKAATDNHLICPCCGGHHTDGATKTHDPRHVQADELRALNLQYNKKVHAATAGPTRAPEAMAAINAERQAIIRHQEAMASHDHDRDVFKVPKTALEEIRAKLELLSAAEALEAAKRDKQFETDLSLVLGEDEKRSGGGPSPRLTDEGGAAEESTTPLRGRLRRNDASGVPSASATPTHTSLAVAREDNYNSPSHQQQVQLQRRPLTTTSQYDQYYQDRHYYPTSTSLGTGTAIATTSGMSLVKSKASTAILTVAPFTRSTCGSGDIATDPRAPILILPPQQQQQDTDEAIALYERYLLTNNNGTNSDGNTSDVDLAPAERREAEDHIDTLMAIAEEEALGNVPGLIVKTRATAVEYTQARARFKALAANPELRVQQELLLALQKEKEEAKTRQLKEVGGGGSRGSAVGSSAAAIASAALATNSAASATPHPRQQQQPTTATTQQQQQLIGHANAPRDLKVSIATTSINCKTVPGKPGRGRTIVLNIM